MKAIGRGIAYGLRNVEVALDTDNALRLIALHGPGGPAARWALRSYSWPGQVVLAIAKQALATNLGALSAKEPDESHFNTIDLVNNA